MKKKDRAPRAYLSFTGETKPTILGVGEFSKETGPVAVADDVARQYESAEMKAIGWVVEWKETEDGAD